MTTELTIISTHQDAGGCACHAPTAAASSTKETDMSSEDNVATYTVAGMTCGHCVASVTEEVSALTAVSGVQVDLATGTVTVTSAAPLDQAELKAAVEEAGYQLVG